MEFTAVSDVHLSHFRSILPTGRVLTDAENLERCSRDQTEDISLHPEVVLQPENTAEVAAIMRYCHEHHIAVTPRGAGTGLSGGAVPAYGGLLLDMKRMDNILHIDTANFQVTTQPGVITQVLQEAVGAVGLFYPPDPASKGSCFIGGNVAENSGGPRAVKYGVVKDYVLNLEVVLPGGEVIWTGANVLKNATGYNLTQLLVGSEGTLGVITQIVLRLIPAIKHNVLMLVPFKSAIDACAAVNTIMLAGHTPSALEFMERDALLYTIAFTGNTSIQIAEDIAAHLLIEVDGNNEDLLLAEMEEIAGLLEAYDTGEMLLATDNQQKDALWSLRRKVGEAVKSQSIYKEEDTVVPRALLPKLLETVKSIGREFNFTSICYGHAGDGNLHVNIVKGNMGDEDWQTKLPVGIRKLFAAVVAMGGTLSGEHGIGLVQKSYMDVAFSPVQMQLMRGIKKLFDPTGIMNPGKVFIEEVETS